MHDEVLEALVRVPSVTGDTDAAVAAFVREALRLGFPHAERDDAGNGVAVAGRGEREILLVGHIDTVAPVLPVRREGRRLFGRGAVDAKGPLAAFLCAAARFRASPTHRIVVVGACDEEGESHGARALIDRYRPEALVIGEPSGVAGVTIGYKGIVKVRYEAEEDLQHTGAPFPSVPDRGVAFWSALQGYLGQQYGDSLFDMPTAKLNEFNTELLPSGRVRVRLSGSARIPPGFDAPALLDFLRQRAGSAKLELPEWSPAWLGDKNAELTRAFIAAIRDEGLTPRYVKKTGTSDANLLVPAWKVPCVAYGPGESALDHTPQESIDLDEFAASVRVLERVLARLTRPS
ncbi:MAG TPA: M20/M25/M40 family metallo-hydrolase [Candidatus Thermoplasmatota archaeon]|nr:M20/M25/M40 family metallo-hydrolase [Candidatus Thermoplasmatota archaeon]